MSVDLAVTASCGCFLTSQSGRANIASCREHGAVLLRAFDGRPEDVDLALTAAYAEQARASERAKLAWWLRAGADGPAAVHAHPEVLASMRELADVLGQHPERWAEAPDGGVS